jgi:hypothetical protein
MPRELAFNLCRIRCLFSNDPLCRKARGLTPPRASHVLPNRDFWEAEPEGRARDTARFCFRADPFKEGAERRSGLWKGGRWEDSKTCQGNGDPSGFHTHHARHWPRRIARSWPSERRRAGRHPHRAREPPGRPSRRTRQTSARPRRASLRRSAARGRNRTAGSLPKRAAPRA